MMNGKRVFAILLLCCMMLWLCAGCGENTDAVEGKTELQFTLTEDGSAYIVMGIRENLLETRELTVPASHEGKPVIIGEKAFYGLPEIVSITVEGAHGMVGKRAFINCPKLETVVLQGDADVDSYCFQGCHSLKSITFGAGIRSIGEECVKDCPNLESIVIGDDCISIGVKAFNSCRNLQSVTLGAGLEEIKTSAFANSIRLTQIQFPTQKPLYIGDHAFAYSGLEELHISANITLGEYVFEHLAWDEVGGYSKCKAVYFYSMEPTAANLGTNSIGYTWDRMEENDPELGRFMVYVPEAAVDLYYDLMLEECDESWDRCVLKMERLDTFVPEA